MTSRWMMAALAAAGLMLAGCRVEQVEETQPPDVQAAYLRLCDPSPGGLPWDRDALPCCPACGAQPAAHERLEELEVGQSLFADIAFVPWVIRARDMLAVKLPAHVAGRLAELEQRPSIAAEVATVRAL